MRAAYTLALLLTAIALSGCCTMASVCMDGPSEESKHPYWGATKCLDAMKHTLCDEHFVAIPDSRVMCFAFQVCDFPLSLVADTVLLPFTVPYTLTHPGQPLSDLLPIRDASSKPEQPKK